MQPMYNPEIKARIEKLMAENPESVVKVIVNGQPGRMILADSQPLKPSNEVFNTPFDAFYLLDDGQVAFARECYINGYKFSAPSESKTTFIEECRVRFDMMQPLKLPEEKT